MGHSCLRLNSSKVSTVRLISAGSNLSNSNPGNLGTPGILFLIIFFQSSRMQKYFNVCHLATGDLLRAEVGRGTQLGKEIKRVIDAGKLVMDSTALPKQNIN